MEYRQDRKIVRFATAKVVFFLVTIFLASAMSLGMAKQSGSSQGAEILGRYVTDMSPQEISNLVNVKKSKFDAETPVIGPAANLKTPAPTSLKSVSLIWGIRSWLSATGRAPESQIYLELIYVDSNWHYYNSVSFVGGDTLAARVIDRQVSDCDETSECIFQEVIGVMVPTQMLIDQEHSNLDFRINSQLSNNIVASIPSTYLEGFLDALRSAGLREK